MSKKIYVMLSLSIFGINGSVQYLYNKISALEKLGWDVILFTGNNGNTVRELSCIYVNALEEYQKFIIPELQFFPECFSKRTQFSIIQSIRVAIPDDADEYIIESNSIETALWGEKLSRQIKAINFWFDLQERHNYSEEEKDYVKFKMRNHSIACITRETALEMLNVSELPQEYMVGFKAYCSNSVQDIEYSIPEYILNAKIKIGFVGRLNKPYVLPALNEIKKYLADKNNEEIALVMIGGAQKESTDLIEKIFSDFPNVHVYITNYIYPIPRNLVRAVDVFVSSSGSAVVSMREGVPTIVYDAEKVRPIGILDYTLRNDLCSEGNYYSLIDLLKDVLDNGFCKYHDSLGMKEKFIKYNYDEEVAYQVQYIKSHSTRECYEKNVIVSGRKEIIQRLLGKLFGVKVLLFLRKMKYWN